MSAKEIVLETVKKMSDKMSMAEILEEIAILAAIREGENAADAGKLISHEEMKKRAKSWNTKSRGRSPPGDSWRKSAITLPQKIHRPQIE